MKIMTFHGGLGNQIFQYAYYLFLCQQYPDKRFYGFYPNRGLKAHNGLEIQKWFDVELPQTNLFINLFSKILFWINKLFWKLQLPHPFTDTDWFRRPNALFYFGYWQDKQYYLKVGSPKFQKNIDLGRENIKLLQMIKETESVAVHIRRGDYLLPHVQKIYGNICTDNYYKHAIAEIKKKVKRPTFFFFSDDKDYIEREFTEIEKIVVSCNKGERSFFDLYLMSHCKNMIIANSTFSTWAAYLNENNPIVICPAKLRNDRPSPPIILDSWIKI